VTAAAPRPPSLRQRLLRTVLLPLALTWVAGTVVSFAVAQYFAQRAFDRSLLDDAYLLATHVRMDGGKLRMELSSHEVNTVLFDQAETMFFSVRAPGGAVVAGQPDLLAPAIDQPETFHFGDIAFAGKVLRAVTLHED
jgi:two-component system sensor histidine kinase TctE